MRGNGVPTGMAKITIKIVRRRIRPGLQRDSIAFFAEGPTALWMLAFALLFGSINLLIPRHPDFDAPGMSDHHFAALWHSKLSAARNTASLQKG